MAKARRRAKSLREDTPVFDEDWRPAAIHGKVRNFDVRLAREHPGPFLIRIDRVSGDRVYWVSLAGWEHLSRDLQRMADGEPTAAGHVTNKGTARGMFYALKDAGVKFAGFAKGEAI